ncbi:hypothetical protein [Sphingobium boeckii]|uniref:Glycosyltransferase n=1 Tax=Sphingobium boeckii TaxID=1082345 RepID=A0A7W9ECK0_9SPHN|nr:hypothetical protein [Sphingobium boeckii]MBB5684348.1 hypothetical protein [Sphingobium boeckii]
MAPSRMAGGTLIFQSCDPAAAPAWVARCVESVRNWAETKGYSHRLLGNELFDPLPPDFASACADRKLPMSDLARLLWCRRFLAEGWDQIVWIDSDVLVLDPAAFAVDLLDHEMLCRELWLWRADGEIRARWAVNNCVMAWRPGSAVLPYYIHACAVLAAAEDGPGTLGLGPAFLTRLNAAAPLPTVDTVMTLSPLLMEAILSGDHTLLANARTLWNAPVYAVHLCGSLSGEGGPMLNPVQRYDQVITALQSNGFPA